MALAKEAQAYQLTKEANERELGKRQDISEQDVDREFHRAQQYMDEARKTYKDILGMNPKEKDFRPGDTRTEEAVAIYATIARYKEEGHRNPQAVASNAASSHDAGSKSSAAAPARTSPLEQVLEFCKQGLDPTRPKPAAAKKSQ